MGAAERLHLSPDGSLPADAKGEVVAMWAELLLFLVVIGLALQQLHAVSKAQKETAEKERLDRDEDDDPVS